MEHPEPFRHSTVLGTTQLVQGTERPENCVSRSIGVLRRAAPSLTCMRAVQITRLGGPEVLDVVDLPDPVPSEGQQLYEVHTAGVNFADTHHREAPERVRATFGCAPL
jgi:hypothetical protein